MNTNDGPEKSTPRSRDEIAQEVVESMDGKMDDLAKVEVYGVDDEGRSFRIPPNLFTHHAKKAQTKE